LKRERERGSKRERERERESKREHSKHIPPSTMMALAIATMLFVGGIGLAVYI